jgi:1-acyl-sn-glycerol-3-phosphate acyltransferase
VVYANHPGWWDPLVSLVLKEHFFPRHTAFTPMDAGALRRYPMFRRMGFFGVERQTRRGAGQFLRTARAVLQSPNHILALTPQGRFADVRERPVALEPGLGHLARQVEEAVFLPVALEYVHWEERLPEILVRFGTPLRLGRRESLAFDAAIWTGLFRDRLEAAQDALADDSRNRAADRFTTLISGRAGQGGIYDVWRRTRSWLEGTPFELRHGNR